MINVFLLDGGDSQVKAVARTLRLSKQKSIRLWIGRTYVNQPPYNNWKDKHVIDDGVGALTNLYFEWNVDNQVVHTLSNDMRNVWWRIKNMQLDFCILSSQPQPKNCMVMFEDSRTDIAYPQGFEVIRCFRDYDSLMNYCKQQGAVRFSLHDSCFFKHEHDIHKVRGAEVYREIATDRLWYFDTFHKDHFEVFEPRGRKHIAEADLNGIIDFSKADDTKHSIV